MKKIIAILILSITLLVAGPTQAVSLTDLQAQISALLKQVSLLQSQLPKPVQVTIPTEETALPTSREQCLEIGDDLYYGMRDGQVKGAISKLQKFLSKTGLLNNTSITGFFGPQTIRAVQAFQRENGIISYGSPETTGYGRVGPSTRKAMQRLCSHILPPTPQIFCTQDAKQCSDGTYVSRIAPTCQFAACPSSPVSATPSLTAQKLDDPQGLTVIFTSTHGDISSYQPSFSDGQDTVIDFGDGTKTQWVQCQNSDTPSFSMHQCASPVAYTHKYKTAGTYTARLIRSGGFCPAPGCPVTELAKTTVTVGSGTTTCTREYRPVCGQPQGCSACPEGAYCAMFCAQPAPKTYSNQCMLNRDSAQFLYTGACKVKSTPTNTAPVIKSFGGPTVIKVHERGTWRIKANDNENDSLTYKVDWGDEPQIIYADTAPARIAFNESYTQSTTFEHTYTQAGQFTVRITVQDEHGIQTNTSTTVHVKETIQKTCRVDDMVFTEGQSTQCIIVGGDARSCIADASYVCRSGEWKVEGGYQYFPQASQIQNVYSNNKQSIDTLIQDFNNGDQDFSQILNQASGFLDQLLAR